MASLKKTISKKGAVRYFKFSMHQIRYFPIPRAEAEKLLAAGEADIFEIEDKRELPTTQNAAEA